MGGGFGLIEFVEQPMNLQELISLLDRNPLPVLGYFLGYPLIVWGLTKWTRHQSLSGSPLRWLYSGLLYGICLPGVIAALSVADSLYRGRLLQISFLSQFLPLLSALACFNLIRQLDYPKEIPGFRRATGFIGLLLVTAFCLFLFMQTRIWIVFGGGILSLLIIAFVLFFILRWAYDRAFGAR